MRKRLRWLAPFLAVGLVAAAGCGEDGGEGNDTPDGELPRNQTLFTTGNAWSPPSQWNPVLASGDATGTRGLCYETLFLFNPWTLELEPWLAESGEWTSDNVYELTLRDNLTWSDGETMNAEDVVFTVDDVGHIPAVRFSNIWDWLESVEAVDDLTVRFTFSDPRRGEWGNFLTNNQIVAEHLWRDHLEGESEDGVPNIMAWANENPVCSGPYTYHSHTEQRMVWEKNEDWWAIEALDLDVKPKYIVDLVNQSNEVVLGLLLTGQVDISNNFLPGIDQLITGDFDITSYYPEPPYMIPANTAMLIPNLEREPMDDAAFRRAVAYTIDVDSIVQNVYGNIVQASNSTGLLPTWDGFVDQAVVNELGFGFDVDEAKRILADAGYEDTDGDGFVETPDGDPIELSLITPSGWTDWNAAAEVVATGAQSAGINIVAETPDSGTVDDARIAGDFDMMFNNFNPLNSTPWSYYDYVFRQPVQEIMANANFQRYENAEAWALVEQMGKLAIDDPAMLDLASQLQRIQLTDMPLIPMWYNGLWSQASNEVWTNWPSSAEGTPDAYPSTWNDQWQKGSIYMLTELELAR